MSSISFSTIIQKARPHSSHIASDAFREVLKKMPPITVSTLKNGFRVACQQNPNTQFATIGLFLNAGTRHEKEGYFGTAKALQKCGLLGTMTADHNSLATKIDALGGHLFAETGREISKAYVKVPKEKVEQAVALLADVTLNARLSDEDVENAKQRCEVERLEFEERPDEVVMDNLHRVAFDTTGAGLGAVLYGFEDDIKALDKQTLDQYRTSNYTAPRMCLVGCGAIDHTILDKAAEKHFGPLARTDPGPKPDHRYVGGDMRLWNLRFKTTHIAWATQVCGAVCEDSVPLTLATQIHGSWHRSQHELGQHAMHRVLKTFSSLDHSTPTTTHFPEKGMEVANRFIQQYSDTGLFGMYFVGRPAPTGPGDGGNMMEVLQWTMSDFCRMTQKMMHEVELEQAKVNYKAMELFKHDGATNSLNTIGQDILYCDRMVPLLEKFDRIDDCTTNNVQEVLQHYFFARRPVYSIMGYAYPLAHYDWSSMWTYKYWY